VFTSPAEWRRLVKFLTHSQWPGATATRSRTRLPSKDRFERGLVLLNWIRSPLIGNGRLTKVLLVEVKHHCRHWREVKEYQRHRSLEKLRNALRNLADDTRRAITAGRVPQGW
jgi:hypothetical protein